LVIEKCLEVVDTLFSNAGGGAVFAGSEIQKIFLDVHTSRAHVANNPVSFSRNYGAMQLGVENTDYFV
jgi:Acyl-CoA dehydrogenase, C-terminal domain.